MNLSKTVFFPPSKPFDPPLKKYFKELPHLSAEELSVLILLKKKFFFKNQIGSSQPSLSSTTNWNGRCLRSIFE